MIKSILISFFCCFMCIVVTDAQNIVGAESNRNSFFLSLGSTNSSFQDVKYSNVKYSGLLVSFGLGYNSNSIKRIWELGLQANISRETASTYDNGKATMLNPIIYFTYLKPVNKTFYVGVRIDAVDLYIRSIEGLGNNGSYLLNGSHLYGTAMVNVDLSKSLKLQGTVNIGLLSYQKEGTSFAYFAPQNVLESEVFDYQDQAITNIFGYKYFELRNITNNLNIRNGIHLQYKKMSIGYDWSLKYFATVKSYPVTIGIHNIVLRYRF